MASVRQNKITTITNDEAYDLATHMARMADSANVIINVNSLAEADAIPSKYAGLAVRRLDIGPMAVDVWTGTAWFGSRVPFGHAGKADGFTAGGQNPTSLSSQVVRGGMTFNTTDKALVIPVAGFYHLTFRVYFSGGNTGLSFGLVLVNAAEIGLGVRWDKVQVDEYMCGSMVKQLSAGDKVSLQTQTPASVYGGDGFNGTWLQAEYKWSV